ncbi:MAG: ATP-dependent DNA helicase RecQ [Saprospiraceae bacterium]
MSTQAKNVLLKYWGYSAFRHPQEEIIDSVLQKQDTLALLPTGGGKSICYQIPALLFGGKTIIVSPLIALMQDQVEALKRKHIKAASIHSSLTPQEISNILDNFEFGDLKLLYVSPERLKSELFLLRIRNVPIDLIAVDEAHCISQWGYDFRPAYFDIFTLRELHPKATMMALTATATPKVVEDITSRLQFTGQYATFKKSFSRDNLYFTSHRTSNKREEIILALQQIKGSAIIYVRNRMATIDIAQWLIQHRISSAAYHGGMEKAARDRAQQQWMEDKTKVMVSTNAFGMGIDKPNVRLVIHLDLPPSIEEYYQEAGRAGRDGKDAHALILTDDKDDRESLNSLDDQYPDFGYLSMVFDGLCRYYDIPYGSGKDETYTFDITRFSSFLKQPLRKIYHAISILEKESWIAVSETFHSPSKIQILTNHEDLMGLHQIGHKYYPILVHILRKYEGLFSKEVKIDEHKLASELKKETDALIHILKQMHQEGIIHYKEKSTKPQLTFLYDRPEIKSFSIDIIAYKERMDRAKYRMKKMIQFVTQNNICRQVYITNYFGEKTKPCGKCDVCLGSESTEMPQKQKEDIKMHLIKILEKGPFPLKSYINLYPFHYRNRVIRLLEIWQNEEIIFVNKNGEISIVPHE